jgi:ADP-ribosylglycohydrolase
MRIAPLGAYFADNPDHAVGQARLASEVTHAHPEGVAGGIAVAVAAALAATQQELEGSAFLKAVLARVPQGEVAAGIRAALRLPARAGWRTAVRRLGNGSRVSAQDTVPFALWCVGTAPARLSGGAVADRPRRRRHRHHLCDGGRDRGGAGGPCGHPRAWLAAHEPLPAWVDALV